MIKAAALLEAGFKHVSQNRLGFSMLSASLQARLRDVSRPTGLTDLFRHGGHDYRGFKTRVTLNASHERENRFHRKKAQALEDNFDRLLPHVDERRLEWG